MAWPGPLPNILTQINSLIFSLSFCLIQLTIPFCGIKCQEFNAEDQKRLKSIVIKESIINDESQFENLKLVLEKDNLHRKQKTRAYIFLATGIASFTYGALLLSSYSEFDEEVNRRRESAGAAIMVAGFAQVVVSGAFAINAGRNKKARKELLEKYK